MPPQPASRWRLSARWPKRAQRQDIRLDGPFRLLITVSKCTLQRMRALQIAVSKATRVRGIPPSRLNKLQNFPSVSPCLCPVLPNGAVVPSCGAYSNSLERFAGPIFDNSNVLSLVNGKRCVIVVFEKFLSGCRGLHRNQRWRHDLLQGPKSVHKDKIAVRAMATVQWWALHDTIGFDCCDTRHQIMDQSGQ